jgi:hypothetical protein
LIALKRHFDAFVADTAAPIIDCHFDGDAPLLPPAKRLFLPDMRAYAMRRARCLFERHAACSRQHRAMRPRRAARAPDGCAQMLCCSLNAASYAPAVTQRCCRH